MDSGSVVRPRAGQGRVIVVGSVNEDTTITAPRLPAPGETITGHGVARAPGGKGANQAVAAARSGAEVVFLGAVGDDEGGRRSLQALRDESVDTTHVLTVGSMPTGTASIVVDDSGENQIVIVSGANNALSAGHVRASLARVQLTARDVCLVGFEIEDAPVLAAAQFARQQGCTVVVNPAPARALPFDLLRIGPVLVPNETEARQLTGQADPTAAARQLCALTGAPVIATVGEDGAWVVTTTHAVRIPAAVVEVRDTTGAGDTLLGALCAGLAEGLTLVDAVMRGVKAATDSVTTAGARSARSTNTALSP